MLRSLYLEPSHCRFAQNIVSYTVHCLQWLIVLQAPVAPTPAATHGPIPTPCNGDPDTAANFVSPEEFFGADEAAAAADLTATVDSGPAVTLSLLTTLQENKKQRSAAHTNMKAMKRAADVETGIIEPKKKAIKVCTETDAGPSFCDVVSGNITVSRIMTTSRYAK
jgi:hypothetical protein